MSDMYDVGATYDPTDDKLRIYPIVRLPEDDYKALKAVGFNWAPQQKCFYAHWSPEREDATIEMCGEIDDEDKTLVDRAAERAERFNQYKENRRRDAESAQRAVESIAGNIPLGQPILVGHHSEKRARKDANRIQAGMEKTLKMWETADYWNMRAKGAVSSANYKEKADVRARRIKKLEAEKRKYEKQIKESNGLIRLWSIVEDDTKWKKNSQPAESGTLRERVLFLCNNFEHGSYSFSLSEYPRSPECTSNYEGPVSLWGAVKDNVITPLQARDLAATRHTQNNAVRIRWVTHLEHRLMYEKAMLDASGYVKPEKVKPKQLPLLNYDAPMVVENLYNRGVFTTYTPAHMTAAEYAKINKDYKGTFEVGGTHRVRSAMIFKNGGSTLSTVFLTDSKVHPVPEVKTPEQIEQERYRLAAAMPPAPSRPAPAPNVDREKAAEMRQAIKAGVVPVVANQLFPTPPELAERMANIAYCQMRRPGTLKVLEPSAGTGNLIQAMIDKAEGQKLSIVGVEKDWNVAKILSDTYPHGHEHVTRLVRDDFMRQSVRGDKGLGRFHVVIMNPPFEHGDDLSHVINAIDFLEPGGVLVAIMADSQKRLDNLVEYINKTEDDIEIEKLPEGSFKTSGTNVNTVLVTITKG